MIAQSLTHFVLFIAVWTCNVSADLEPHDRVDFVPCDMNGGEPCGLNEVCISADSTARVGFCKCAQGFTRNEEEECFKFSSGGLEVKSKLNTEDSTQIKKKIDLSKDVVFTIEGPSSVRLPEHQATLQIVLSNPESGPYTYHWELLSGTGQANSESYNEASLRLTDLKEGTFQYKATVRNTTHSFEDVFELNVLSPIPPNKAPVAVIRPESPVHGVEGSQIVLDAEGSQDDSKIVSYKWSQDQGPSVNLPALNTAVLKLDNLLKGEYTFTVLVTDDSKASSNATVQVIVDAERDDPPKAMITQCGHPDSGSISVRLPFDELKLCGNSSTDDKGIQSYSWFRADKLAEKLTVDTAGSSTSILTLTNVQANEKYGPYLFQLDVKDTKGQTDSTRIAIFVNKAENLSPDVSAGGNRTIILPETSVVLDGNVKDDGSIVSYKWTQISGPFDATIINANKPKATISNLALGTYEFQLTVVDDGGLNGTDSAFIVVERGQNEAPVAVAHNVSVRLPASIAILNGSDSYDDAGIVSFRWEPSDSVPAAMMALDGSDNNPVMFLSGLVVGSHLYTLTVADQQRAFNATSVYLNVVQGDEDLESIEIVFDTLIQNWSHRLRAKLETRLSAVLSSAIVEVNEVDIHFAAFGGTIDGLHVRAVFWASVPSKDELTMKRKKRSAISSNGVIFAREAVRILQQEWSMLGEFNISSINTKYCKLDCSGHGTCSHATKQCVCDSFWMSNLFVTMMHGWRHSDCSWSSLYFWLLVISFTIVFGVCFSCRRRSSLWGRVSRRRFRRRKRYSALNTDSEKDNSMDRQRTEPRLKPLPIPPSSDSLQSESDELLGDSSWELPVTATRSTNKL